MPTTGKKRYSFINILCHVYHFLDVLTYLSSNDKRGYNPLKVENLVDLPPETDPTDPLFQHQWYLVSKYFFCLLKKVHYIKVT